jgi:hypothetical protein
MSEELFEDAGEQVETAVDPDVERRKSLVAGEEELKKADFGKDTEQWEMYSTQVKNTKAVYKGQPEFIKAQIKTLHSGKSPFNKYLPGKTSSYSAPSSKIPELNKLNELAGKAHEAFETYRKTMQEIAEFDEYFGDIIPDGATVTVKNRKGEKEEVAVEKPVFTPYWSGLNPMRNYIKQNYKEQ